MTGGDDLNELLRRWGESEHRSRERRSKPPRRRRRLLVVVVGVVLAVAAGVAAATLDLRSDPTSGTRTRDARPPRDPVAAGVRGSPALPSRAGLRRAWTFARRRGGQVSVAVLDTRGRLRGRDAGRRYPSASVVKAMLLAAELRRLRREELPLDEPTGRLLTGMIVTSDNDSADAVYARVKDDGLLEVAKATGMRRFRVGGSWGYVQVTAADLARFFSRLRTLVPRPHRRMALRLLASIEPKQRWGIPKAAGRAWRVHFKGGWRETGRGELAHQAAWLHRGGRDLSIAILTDAQPSRTYAFQTVRGVADRLLGR